MRKIYAIGAIVLALLAILSGRASAQEISVPEIPKDFNTPEVPQEIIMPPSPEDVAVVDECTPQFDGGCVYDFDCDTPPSCPGMLENSQQEILLPEIPVEVINTGVQPALVEGQTSSADAYEGMLVEARRYEEAAGHLTYQQPLAFTLGIMVLLLAIFAGVAWLCRDWTQRYDQRFSDLEPVERHPNGMPKHW